MGELGVMLLVHLTKFKVRLPAMFLASLGSCIVISSLGSSHLAQIGMVVVVVMMMMVLVVVVIIMLSISPLLAVHGRGNINRCKQG